ncbi:Succinate-semialdehyde dehydrogenase [NADP(+)] GabD [Gemmata obscuriglobus]|uniref:Succinate-semialdehyde dehydrogenase (NADP(+)) n=1 Tax=Gemmata obscuriglobus TaxID=114 RepID=A0A2Z3GW13_9BACT|nr:NAD-dependent succinate-semialdehyde dehydrogenase [Gemmata obscuriglobus]AWM37913.1 succinate-semialdehyde dehydrogenase (NADP(+)) [Gemmata obscuriglobus]QEG29232.1 Succinate-semialdehyde dehydrogenase [NADP(+)] GabD [Gemmata obscuriglobus]VTS08041.1 succinate-semialdehyde dehydrogenase : NAD-dependent aldehyde dehydrogenase OS=Singulisphaera acidiphila (strain ATCC BAA-1392 / DSM 18658 / VKM B-2454 / MOB10) GN=Sinac_1922 PE=3 SV=1: Aldedh [Gemmata obscuriglobus UQM 2246]
MSALPVKNRQLFINGAWCESSTGNKLPVVNPATEETLADVSFGNRADTAKAVAAASAALPGWMKLTPYDRAKFLKKIADLMRERADAISRVMTMEQGKPLVEAKGEVMHSADTFEWFAEEGKRAYGQVIPPANAAKRHMTIKHPVGVVGAIAPWNFPLTLLCRKIAPALAAGCTIVAKPSELTPLCGIALFELIEDAKLPPGVANMVLGPGEEVATEFMENPAVRKVSFTGSTRVGKILMKQAADQVKRLSLELGGHAPFIVFPDADPEVVAKAAVLGKFRNNGQVCISPSRFFVHQDIAKKFTEVAVEEAKKLKLGNGLEDGVVVGPMIEQKRVDATRELIADATGKGAACLTGGGRPKGSAFEHGYFMEPTILRGVTPDAKILTDEPFAPVMPVLDFSKLDEVIAAANSTKYGLAAYVFTNDLSIAWRMAEGLEAGIIGLNDPVPATPQCPFGGMKESGMGRELAHEGLEAYLETKYVSMMLRG